MSNSTSLTSTVVARKSITPTINTASPAKIIEDYQNEVPRKRHSRLTLVTAITGLALIGSAGAFGYRNILSGPVILTARPSH